MSEDIQRLRTEYESLVSQHQDTSSTLAPWIVREEEFFATYGLSSQHVKMIAGLGLMVTCFLLMIFLIFLCSRHLRPSQFTGPVGIGMRQKIISEKLKPPCYEEVLEIDNTNLPSYWQASKGESIQHSEEKQRY